MNRNDVVLGGGGERSPVVVVPTNWPASWNHLGARTKAERSGRVPGAARWPFPAETISRFSPSFTSSSCAPSSNKVTMYPEELAAMEKYFLSVLTPVSERFMLPSLSPRIFQVTAGMRIDCVSPIRPLCGIYKSAPRWRKSTNDGSKTSCALPHRSRGQVKSSQVKSSSYSPHKYKIAPL